MSKKHIIELNFRHDYCHIFPLLLFLSFLIRSVSFLIAGRHIIASYYMDYNECDISLFVCLSRNNRYFFLFFFFILNLNHLCKSDCTERKVVFPFHHAQSIPLIVV